MTALASPPTLAESPPAPGDWRLADYRGFAAHNGPFWRDAVSGDLTTRITQERSNIAGRVHGGMSMSMQTLALTEAARATRPADALRLVTLDCELLDSALPGDWITATVRVERATRTLVFTTGRLHCGGRLMMTASAVFAAEPDAGPAPGEQPDVAPDGWHLQQPKTPFCAHVGPIYERFDAAGERFGAFRVCPRHLRADGAPELDSGMLLMLADLYLGRRANQTAGGPCVTLGMTLSQTAPIRLGELVLIDSVAQGQSAECVIVTGSVRVGDTQVASLTSSWKKVARR